MFWNRRGGLRDWGWMGCFIGGILPRLRTGRRNCSLNDLLGWPEASEGWDSERGVGRGGRA